MLTVNDYLNKKITKNKSGKPKVSRPELFIKECNARNGIKIDPAVTKKSLVQATQVAKKTVLRKRLPKLQHRFHISKVVTVVAFHVLLNMGLLEGLALKLECLLQPFSFQKTSFSAPP